MIDPIEATCAMVDSLIANHVSAKAVADAILAVPLTHPLRWHEKDGHMADSVLDMAARVSKGLVPPDELRAFCEALRAGKAEMMATGWYATLHGPFAEAV